jgi:hypothetical protein
MLRKIGVIADILCVEKVRHRTNCLVLDFRVRYDYMITGMRCSILETWA